MNFYNIQQHSSEENDEKAPVQIIIEKITRQLSNENEVHSEPKSIYRTNSIVSSPLVKTEQNFLSNFCWFNFNTNKLLVANNRSILGLKILSLHDKIVVSWSPNGDFYWTSKFSNINSIKNLDIEFNYIKELKKRCRLYYGLKYSIINVVNGSVHLSHSINNYETKTASANRCQATPLALAFHSQFGLAHLLTADFHFNFFICDQDKSSCSQNLKSLWNWFESIG